MQPTVSVIVPCFNEQATIGSLLSAIYAQTYPRQQLEVVIVDGLSEDGTRREIAAFRETHPDLALRLVDNETRTIPSGLNLGIRAARGEILVRLDAHSEPIPEYVSLCVVDIEQGKGENVGGVWTIAPGGPGWVARGIAAAAAHPLGAGDALYRLGGEARSVDTVPFGAFRRQLIDQVGGFDESLLTNEDYEFNVRIRRHGGVVWMDPRIRSRYTARAKLGDLARQYWRYGFWKYRMLQRYPGSLRWRQALPPLFVLALIGLATLSLFWIPAAGILGLLVAIYLLALLAAGLQLSWRQRDVVLAPGAMLAFVTMHFSWGSGFLQSALTAPARNHD